MSSSRYNCVEKEDDSDVVAVLKQCANYFANLDINQVIEESMTLPHFKLAFSAPNVYAKLLPNPPKIIETQTPSVITEIIDDLISISTSSTTIAGALTHLSISNKNELNSTQRNDTLPSSPVVPNYEHEYDGEAEFPPVDEAQFNIVYWEEPTEIENVDSTQALKEKRNLITVEKGSSMFSPLTSAALARLQFYMSDLQNSGQILNKVNGIELTGNSLRRLKPGAWLNDEIINMYLTLLERRSNDLGNKVPKVKVMNTFLYSKLTSKGYDFSKVRRWNRKYNLLSYDVLLIPINSDNLHWSLGVLNLRQKKVMHLDSMGSGGATKTTENLLQWLEDNAKLKNVKFDRSKWTFTQVFVPQQTNSDDCGVFTCKFADVMCRGWNDFPFTPVHMLYFRARIAHELLMGKVS